MPDNKPNNKQAEEHLGTINFGKLSPEEQKRISRENMPANNDELAINEKLALENAKKAEEKQSKHVQ